MGGRIEPAFQCPQLLNTDLARWVFTGCRAGGVVRCFGNVLVQCDGIGTNTSDIWMVSRCNPQTVLTLATRQAVDRLGTQKTGGRGQGKLLLSDARHAVNQPGMGKTITLCQPRAGQI